MCIFFLKSRSIDTGVFVGKKQKLYNMDNTVSNIQTFFKKKIV
jgi:hypothetical protein